MATVNITVGSTTGFPNPSRAHGVYILTKTVDFGYLLTAKGSALAAGDVFNIFNLPANSAVVSGGAIVTTVANSTTCAISLGTSASSKLFVDTADVKTATGVCAAGSTGSTGAALATNAAATVDLTLTTLTGTLTAGQVTVWVAVANVNPLVTFSAATPLL